MLENQAWTHARETVGDLDFVSRMEPKIQRSITDDVLMLKPLARVNQMLEVQSLAKRTESEYYAVSFLKSLALNFQGIQKSLPGYPTTLDGLAQF